jgi:hypothetical protein
MRRRGGLGGRLVIGTLKGNTAAALGAGVCLLVLAGLVVIWPHQMRLKGGGVEADYVDGPGRSSRMAGRTEPFEGGSCGWSQVSVHRTRRSARNADEWTVQASALPAGIAALVK